MKVPKYNDTGGTGSVGGLFPFYNDYVYARKLFFGAIIIFHTVFARWYFMSLGT